MVQGRPYGLHIPRTLEAWPVANAEPDAIKRKAPPERGQPSGWAANNTARNGGYYSAPAAEGRAVFAVEIEPDIRRK